MMKWKQIVSTICEFVWEAFQGLCAGLLAYVRRQVNYFQKK